jgi:hypothetical protein
VIVILPPNVAVEPLRPRITAPADRHRRRAGRCARRRGARTGHVDAPAIRAPRASLARAKIGVQGWLNARR